MLGLLPLEPLADTLDTMHALVIRETYHRINLDMRHRCQQSYWSPCIGSLVMSVPVGDACLEICVGIEYTHVESFQLPTFFLLCCFNLLLVFFSCTPWKLFTLWQIAGSSREFLSCP